MLLICQIHWFNIVGFSGGGGVFFFFESVNLNIFKLYFFKTKIQFEYMFKLKFVSQNVCL